MRGSTRAIIGAGLGVLLLSSSIGTTSAQTPAINRHGAGDSQVGQFINNTGSFTVCVQATGNSPSGIAGPMATLFVEMVMGTGPESYSFDYTNIDMVGNPGCQQDSLEPGMYSAKVSATSWTNWTVSITPGGGSAAPAPAGAIALNTISPASALASLATNPDRQTVANAGASMGYSAGWNLVAAPGGTSVAGASAPLYTWQAGDTIYESIPSGSGVKAGQGYWGYFAAGVTNTIPATTGGTVQVLLPPGTPVMIGNSGSTTALVTGADSMTVYTPSQGSTLLPPR